MKTKKNFGFTLAEVTLTLAVVGTVAALTIPDLISSMQDKILKTKWKSAYSDVNQVFTKMRTENGGTLLGTFTDSSSLKAKFKQYVIWTKDCNDASTDGCAGTAYTNLNGEPDYLFSSRHGLLLVNSVTLAFSGNSLCNDNDSTYILNRCAEISVDVNGSAPPNVEGKDVFRIYAFKTHVKPAGCKGDLECNDYWQNTCDPTRTDITANGRSCSAKYLYSD